MDTGPKGKIYFDHYENLSIHLAYFRSAKDFLIHIANCEHDWTEVVSDMLPDAQGVSCENIPLKEYTINRVGKYVRFMAITHYGAGPVLKYINIETDYPNGIQTDQMPCPGYELFLM